MTAIDQPFSRDQLEAWSDPRERGFRNALAEKIFLDRYALRETSTAELAVHDVVVFCPNADAPEGARRREVGLVVAVHADTAEVRPVHEPEASPVTVRLEHLDLPAELSWDAMARRVAEAIAAVESDPDQRAENARAYREVIAEQRFIPAGRILAGAGVAAAGGAGELTFYNCFVLPSPRDSREGILETAAAQLEIMSRGGGVGINVSSLRPRFDRVEGVQGRSSGAASWADLFSFLTGKVEQGGSRRGALMLVLDVWHPDIERFIDAKREPGVLENANLSVGISDAFLEAVEADEPWHLVFPDRTHASYDATWNGDLAAWRAAGGPVRVHRTVRARELYRRLCEAAWASAEPGVVFTDRVNALSNSHGYVRLTATNPCGEQPLPPWGVCNLGAINLSRFVRPTAEGGAFWPAPDLTPDEGLCDRAYDAVFGRIDYDAIAETAFVTVRFLDAVIDASPHFLEPVAVLQQAERRVGLGVMGLAELLIRVGVPYDSELARWVAESIFETIRNAAYGQSVELAREKGPFPRFEREAFLASGYAKTLPKDLRQRIAEHGIRNVTLLTVAPTGTTATMVATSTGIEPYYLFEHERRGRLGTHHVREAVLEDYQTDLRGDADVPLPPQFQTAGEISVEAHVRMMSSAQRYVDAAISKTCNLPAESTIEDVERFYLMLHELGCKGGTVYRDGSRNGQILNRVDEAKDPEGHTDQVLVEPTTDSQSAPVKDLPGVPRQGFTHAVPTPIGRVHVTLNSDPADGSPFDVFITLSKAGSDTDADTDAIGRLLSLLLRLNVGLASRTRLELAIEQLRGIATSRSVGFGPDKIRSVPDGIAACLEVLLEQLDVAGAAVRPSVAAIAATLPGTPGETEVDAASRGAFMQVCPDCGNASAARVDGCFKCFGCGYSEC